MYRLSFIIFVVVISLVSGCGPDNSEKKIAPKESVKASVTKHHEEPIKSAHNNFVDYHVGPRPSDPVCADLNGDGANDIAVALKKQALSVLFNNGSGVFSDPAQYETLAHNTSLISTDIDQDGDMDLIPLTEMRVGPIFLNDGKGNFTKHDINIIGLPFSWHIDAADLNNDHLPDLIVSALQTPRIMILINKGDLTFSKYIYDLSSDSTFNRLPGRMSFQGKRKGPGAAWPHGLGSANATRAGMNQGQQVIKATVHPDPAKKISDTERIRLRRAQGQGQMPNGIKDFVMADVNGDGSVDILMPSYLMNAIYTGVNDGHGKFEFFETYVKEGEVFHNSLSSIALIKSPKKKLPDVAVSSESNSAIYVFQNQGGKLVYKETIDTGIRLPVVRIASADFDADGWSDIIAVFAAPLPRSNKSTVRIWYNKNGHFEPGPEMTSNGYGAYVDVCRLGGDVPDIIVSNLHEETITVLRPVSE